MADSGYVSYQIPVRAERLKRSLTPNEFSRDHRALQRFSAVRERSEVQVKVRLGMALHNLGDVGRHHSRADRSGNERHEARAAAELQTAFACEAAASCAKPPFEVFGESNRRCPTWVKVTNEFR